jgi:hypothetical protein
LTAAPLSEVAAAGTGRRHTPSPLSPRREPESNCGHAARPLPRPCDVGHSRLRLSPRYVAPSPQVFTQAAPQRL